MFPRIGAATRVALIVLLAAACSKSKPATGEASSSRADAGHVAEQVSQEAIKLCQHQVPADQCTQCNPELIEAFKDMGDWCEEHAVPKSHCRQCDSNLTFTASAPKDWCKEHAVPESMCTKCKPKLIARFIKAGDYCREHGYPASVCPIHHPELVKAAGAELPVFPAPGTKVRLASPSTAKEAGIETVRIERKRIGETLEVVGQLDFNQNRLAQLSARGEALIVDVQVDLGDDVKAGQALATLASAAVGSGQAQLMSAEARVRAARAALSREEALVKKGVTSRKDFEAAQTEVAAAEGEYNAARAALSAAGAIGGTAGRYVLQAPFAGTVVARDAVAGRSAAPGQVLLQVADLSTMWAQLDVPEGDASLVRPGQVVSLSFEGVRGGKRTGTITRVAASVDASSRTVRARLELPNQDRALKAGSFLRARIQVSEERDSLLIPSAALQRAEGRTLVFVMREPAVYEPIPVELGTTAGDFVEVVQGLSAGMDVVTSGAFLLKTEVLKDSIGAGCCEEGGGE